MFRFVASDGTGSVKRQQAQKHATPAGSGKKRCNHTTGGISTSANSSPARASNQLQSDDQVSQGAIKPYIASYLSCTKDAEYQSTVSPEEPGTISPVASNLASSDQDLEAARILSGGVHIQAKMPQIQEPAGVQSRFIGDLNPESIFLAATSPDAISGVLPDSVGVYLSSTLGKKPHHFSNLQQTSSNLFLDVRP